METNKIYKVEAIIRPEKLDELKDALFAIKVTGMTVSDVYGCGLTRGQSEIYRGKELPVNLMPKTKVEIVISRRLSRNSSTPFGACAAPATWETGRSSYPSSPRR